MPHLVKEDFAIMDNGTVVTTFGKQKVISVSRPVAVSLLFLFIGSVVVTGLVVYSFTSSCSSSTPSSASTINSHFGNGDEGTLVEYEEEAAFSTTSERISLITGTGRKDEEEEVTTTVSSIVNKKTDDDEDDVRLPRSVHPHSYKIKLIPFIQEGNFTFHGQVAILVNVTKTSKNITLHADDLIINHNIQVMNIRNNVSLGIREISNDRKKQFLIIHLGAGEAVEKGEQYLIRISFKGVLNDLLKGFYRSSYKIHNETRWIATTQFQPTDARNAFPCFDEPALKAKFQISLARLKNMTSISNMRKISNAAADDQLVENLDNYVWDVYEESVPMSTYLLAFVISDFKAASNGNFSIWVRESALSQTKYSLEIGPRILKYYEEFFGIKYPLPKMDMIGIPDFSAGAMENWGLITYRESVLLYEPKTSSKSSLQRIAHVVAHELAHQWFGNLVTPTWWSDLWLNEGFATYMESLGADAVNPHLKELDQFVINELHSAFALDALKFSHPISVKVYNPDEINDIFDRISYSKGAAVLRMMQHFLTMPVFQRGLNKYLTSRMYSNAEQDDLWRVLTEQSHKEGVIQANITIKEIMDTWTLQTGFPLVNVERNYAQKSVKFTQERFYVDKESSSLDSNQTLWWIPVTFTDKTHQLESTWIRNDQSSISLNGIQTGHEDWILVNVNQTGYYRVNYDSTNWNLIGKQLRNGNHLVFDAKNRAQLLDDTLNLAAAGYLDYEVALNLTLYLEKEREFVPWKAALHGLDYLKTMFQQTAHFDLYKKYFLKLIAKFYDELSFEEGTDDDFLMISNRVQLYHRACKLGLRSCIINTVQQFENWKNSPNPDKRNLISENMRDIVYCTAISAGSEEEWDFAWQRYINANVESERITILMALGCSKEVWILNRYLQWSITEGSGIRKQDMTRVFISVASNPVGQQVAYRFLKANWDRIRAYLGTSSMMLSDIIKYCTISFNTQVELDDFKTFLRLHQDEFGIAMRTALQSIELTNANIKWMDNYFEKIVLWLSKF